MRPGQHDCLSICEYYKGIKQSLDPKSVKTGDMIYCYRTNDFYDIVEFRVDGVLVENSNAEIVYFPDFMLSRSLLVGKIAHV